jgi:hypothetical protein
VSALEEKKAEIEKLLEEFEWHLTRFDEITRKTTQKLSAFTAFCKEQGQSDGIAVAIGLFERLKKFAIKAQELKAGAIPGNSNVV